MTTVGKYPYILNTGSLKRFLEIIPKIGTPPKITQPILPTLGFKSTADRPIVPILRFIDFLNDSNEPTQQYKDFRVAGKSGSVMASALRKAYGDIFEIYPDAYDKDDKTLKDLFTPTTDAGEQVVLQTVATFKVLCSFGDFKPGVSEKSDEESANTSKDPEPEKANKILSQNGINLNVNIQLNLPITDDASVYDKIFKAIKDNLVSKN